MDVFGSSLHWLFQTFAKRLHVLCCVCVSKLFISTQVYKIKDWWICVCSKEVITEWVLSFLGGNPKHVPTSKTSRLIEEYTNDRLSLQNSFCLDCCWIQTEGDKINMNSTSLTSGCFEKTTALRILLEIVNKTVSSQKDRVPVCNNWNRQLQNFVTSTGWQHTNMQVRIPNIMPMWVHCNVTFWILWLVWKWFVLFKKIYAIAICPVLVHYYSFWY